VRKITQSKYYTFPDLKTMSKIDSTIISVLEKLSQVQRTLMWEMGKKEKLSPVQIQFLQYIHKHPEKLCTVSQIARDFDLTKATVSDAISTLESKNMISKSVGEEDRRSYTLALTTEGKKTAKRIAKWSDLLRKQIETFPEDEKENVLRFLMELVKSLFDAGAINIPRLCILCGNFHRNAEPESDRPHYCSFTGNYVSESELTAGCSTFKEN
jgi:DNA-binding MarR family transcriptional regulator